MNHTSFGAWGLALLLACSGCTAGSNDADSPNPDLNRSDQIDNGPSSSPDTRDMQPGDDNSLPGMSPGADQQQSQEPDDTVDQQPAQRSKGAHGSNDNDRRKGDY